MVCAAEPGAASGVGDGVHSTRASGPRTAAQTARPEPPTPPQLAGPAAAPRLLPMPPPTGRAPWAPGSAAAGLQHAPRDGTSMPLPALTARPLCTHLQAGLAAQAAAEVDRLPQDLLRGRIAQVHVPRVLVDCSNREWWARRRGRCRGGGRLHNAGQPGAQRWFLTLLHCCPWLVITRAPKQRHVEMHGARSRQAAAGAGRRRTHGTLPAGLGACRAAPPSPLLAAGCLAGSAAGSAPQTPCKWRTSTEPGEWRQRAASGGGGGGGREDRRANTAPSCLALCCQLTACPCCCRHSRNSARAACAAATRLAAPCRAAAGVPEHGLSSRKCAGGRELRRARRLRPSRGSSRLQVDV